ncbi:coiled-coil domain-containing protein 80 isoform X2 [Neoarius graeffei]|nr:coiled-coil domain-containing protein 80 isoform X2 [Neoarius graeffei]
MRLFQTHVVLCVLLWTVDASDFKSSEGTHFTRTQAHAVKRHMELQSNTFAAISGNTPLLQADQATNSSRSPARRVLKGPRPLLQTSSNTQPVEKPDVLHAHTDISAPRQGSPSSDFRISNRTSSINILARFAGKNRLLVVSVPYESDRYYRLMMSLLKPDVYCQMADRHIQQIIMFHGKEELGGKVRHVNNDGSVVEEQLEPALVPRLMSFLKLEEGKFGMVLLRKTLQVEERYPYPVLLEAMYEIIDQLPMRRLEKVRQKGFVEKCKATGMQGKVVQSIGRDPKSNVHKGSQDIKMAEGVKHPSQPIHSTTTQSTTKVTRRRITIHIATMKPATTTAASTTQLATTISSAKTTTTASTTLPTTLPSTVVSPTTLSTTVAHRHKAQLGTLEPVVTRKRQRGHNVINPSITSDLMIQHRDKHRNRTNKISPGTRRQKPIKDKPPKRKNVGREQITEHIEEQEAGSPTASEPAANLLTTKMVKVLPKKAEKKKKPERTEKPVKKNTTEKKVAESFKDAKVTLHNRKVAQKASSLEDKDAVGKPTKKPADTKRALETFLGYFEKRRRLLVITTPNENNKMYSQQKGEYLEQVCDMALRKISIITIFGPVANGTMKIDHYQMEQDKPVYSLPVSELINQELITAFRKELGMVYNDFFMVLTDFDMKVKQEYEVPIVLKAVFDYIDTFSSRLKEMELQRKLGIACKKEDKSRSLESFLSRFRWRRRLLVISTPNEEEWAYQQQLHALTSQACNLGLRHMSVLKLSGRVMEDMGGVLELYPINGSATIEREDLSASLVYDIRNYFQVTADYFSMLLVGKDGNVKSWYPSPMWSMSIIYELIDSMQLRRQELAIQLSFGMHCPEEEYGHHEDSHRGFGY